MPKAPGARRQRALPDGGTNILSARSKTGDAIAAAGDLEGTTSNVAVPARGVTLTIDHVHE